MRGIIVLITTMTVLIFAGLALLVYGIAARSAHPPVPPRLEAVVLPSVGSIQNMSAWRDGVAMYVVSPKGDYLYFIDPQRKDGEIRVPVKREK